MQQVSEPQPADREKQSLPSEVNSPVRFSLHDGIVEEMGHRSIVDQRWQSWSGFTGLLFREDDPRREFDRFVVTFSAHQPEEMRRTELNDLTASYFGRPIDLCSISCGKLLIYPSEDRVSYQRRVVQWIIDRIPSIYRADQMADVPLLIISHWDEDQQGANEVAGYYLWQYTGKVEEPPSARMLPSSTMVRATSPSLALPAELTLTSPLASPPLASPPLTVSTLPSPFTPPVESSPPSLTSMILIEEASSVTRMTRIITEDAVKISRSARTAIALAVLIMLLAVAAVTTIAVSGSAVMGETATIMLLLLVVVMVILLLIAVHVLMEVDYSVKEVAAVALSTLSLTREVATKVRGAKTGNNPINE